MRPQGPCVYNDPGGRICDQGYPPCAVLYPEEQAEYEAGKVVSLLLTQQPGAGISLFAFDGVRTSALTLLQETQWQSLWKIDMDGAPYTLNAGEGIPYVVQAVTAFKMYLVVIEGLRFADIKRTGSIEVV